MMTAVRTCRTSELMVEDKHRGRATLVMGDWPCSSEHERVALQPLAAWFRKSGKPPTCAQHFCCIDQCALLRRSRSFMHCDSAGQAEATQSRLSHIGSHLMRANRLCRHVVSSDLEALEPFSVLVLIGNDRCF
eukprot:6204699-Pleurochrysis_carterae.AAC.2